LGDPAPEFPKFFQFHDPENLTAMTLQAFNAKR
jgi:hypothetical protein